MKLIQVINNEEYYIRNNEEHIALTNKLYAYGDISVGFEYLTKNEQVKLINALVICESVGLLHEAAEKLKQSINEIESKILNRKASMVERRIYSAYLSRCLFNRVPINKDILNICAMQIITEKDEICEDNIFVLAQYALNYICQIEDRNIKLRSAKVDSLMSSNFGDIYVINMNRSLEKYLNISLSKKDSEEMLVLLVFAILHEVQHIAAYKDIRGNNDLDNSRVFRESVVIAYKPKLYQRNHDSFTMERNANQHALDFIFYLLKGIIDENRIMELMNKFGVFKALESKDINDKIDKLYSKVLNRHFDEVEELKKTFEGLSSSRK